jgi:hypothetical protein
MQFSDFFGSAGNHLVETVKIVFFRMLPRAAQIQKARQEINGGVLRKYGKVTGLEIDKENRVVRAALEVKGETESIEVTLSNYRLDGTGFEPGTVKVSREWLDELVKTLITTNVIPKRIEVKSQLHRTVLETLLR